ncbi:MAG TPA: hypothetical protein EYQ24_17265 [Bacteroidetes bacterium]|nr:hypothetical protein [Bacteroidota bacterium]HIL57889.1 hypothetical protein [Rhodothermales bacterium]
MPPQGGGVQSSSSSSSGSSGSSSGGSSSGGSSGVSGSSGSSSSPSCATRKVEVPPRDPRRNTRSILRPRARCVVPHQTPAPHERRRSLRTADPSSSARF